MMQWVPGKSRCGGLFLVQGVSRLFVRLKRRRETIIVLTLVLEKFVVVSELSSIR